LGVAGVLTGVAMTAAPFLPWVTVSSKGLPFLVPASSQRWSALDKIEGISYVKNVAAFYLFPKLDVKKFNITSDKQFARDLLTEAKILVVPGSGFDWPDPDHFRIVMLPEAGELRAAMERMGNFLDGYRQK
jgi:aspartate/methionine/tyrosine aminotransferase